MWKKYLKPPDNNPIISGTGSLEIIFNILIIYIILHHSELFQTLTQHLIILYIFFSIVLNENAQYKHFKSDIVLVLGSVTKAVIV